jgi:ATP-dependent RNA helicase SUPV3L1/SUV3
MQRFVDRRTSVLLRTLSQGGGSVLGGIGADGAVIVEGHCVGRLSGVHFEPERGATALENRALRAAVERAVAPEIARRLGELASESDEAFALQPGGLVDWRGKAAGEITGGGAFAPRVRLLSEIGAEATRERAARRLEAFVAAEANCRLGALKRLGEAMADGRLRGLARGVAYQLVESFGILDRGQADEHIRALSRQERRSLKSLGVRFGAFSLYLPALLAPEARAIGAMFADLAAPRWRPAADGPSVLPHPAPPPEALSLRGLRAVAGMALPVLALERLDALARAPPERAGAIELTAEFAAGLGWTLAQGEQILRGLGFRRGRGRDSTEASLWRRRSLTMRTPPCVPREAPPAAPEKRAAPSAVPARRARRRRARRRAAAGGRAIDSA